MGHFTRFQHMVGVTVTASGYPVSDANPFCAAFTEDPYPVYEALRNAGPVVWLSGHGVWAVARHEQVNRVLNDWEVFSSARGVGLIGPVGE